MQFIRDILWGYYMVKARRLRRRLTFTRRATFDGYLRPRIEGGTELIAYPDAPYHATGEDFARATHFSQQ